MPPWIQGGAVRGSGLSDGRQGSEVRGGLGERNQGRGLKVWGGPRRVSHQAPWSKTAKESGNGAGDAPFFFTGHGVYRVGQAAQASV